MMLSRDCLLGVSDGPAALLQPFTFGVIDVDIVLADEVYDVEAFECVVVVLEFEENMFSLVYVDDSTLATSTPGP